MMIDEWNNYKTIEIIVNNKKTHYYELIKQLFKPNNESIHEYINGFIPKCLNGLTIKE